MTALTHFSLKGNSLIGMPQGWRRIRRLFSITVVAYYRALAQLFWLQQLGAF